ncbi:MAG: accessory gene regulator B family protein [Anaeromicrobium sp.]|jgi:accessory gene regulator B|uniref:accessory gene regulator ArgB-like protein n=1 Tax=Anaeromicrobium sp. TaxID=1929132 RepID=UPI0025CE0856|nr:accessory gene regulator B family protein [Anaeromicrobium sp.]MCT4594545.1 accessory gene regulator B family protein [Anaeromicrobium sp.]
MDLIHKLSNHISEKIENELNHDNDQREVIKYGVFVSMQILYSILVSIIIGLVCGTLKEILIISFTASILRRYSGGVHATSLNRCVVIGNFIFGVMALGVKYIYLSNHISLYLIGGIFLYGYYVIFKYVPVDTESKRIKNDIKRKKLRNKSLVLLSIYLIITMLFIKDNVSMAIAMGIFYQIFTLTKLGNVTLSKLDNILSNIIN